MLYRTYHFKQKFTTGTFFYKLENFRRTGTTDCLMCLFFTYKKMQGS
jgi:hypothetical protein